MTHPRTATRRAVLALALAALPALPAPAAAQDERVGDFHVRLPARRGQDRALALVFPHGQRGYGALMWACEGRGNLAGLRLNRGLANGTLVDVQLRWDGGQPETLRLRGGRDRSVWIASAQDGARLAERARSASRLVVTVPRDTAADSGAEYTYSLAGAAGALGRLACAGGRGRAAGTRTLAAASEVPWLDAGGRLTDAEPFVPPRPVNAQEFIDTMRRATPAPLLSEGMRIQAVVRFHILEDGRVDPASVVVVRSSRRPRFDAAAVAAIKLLRHVPAVLYGRPTDLWVEQPLAVNLRADQLGGSGAYGPRARESGRPVPVRSGCSPSGGPC